jgi:acyl carrier protein
MTEDLEAQLVRHVVHVLRKVLRDPGRSLAADTALESEADFDSHALYRLIAELETALDAELDPELIVPQTFATPATIAKAFAGRLGANAAFGTTEVRQ